MPKLIKDGGIISNDWETLAKEFDGSSLSANCFVPLDYFLANTETLLGREDIGVWLDSDEGPESLAPYIDRLHLIAINFPKFVDGRGYSYAYILRQQLGYTGELRAIGDVLHDQLFYLKRCGFDAFALREDVNAEVALNGLTDFSESYQASIDQPAPLFRRRA